MVFENLQPWDPTQCDSDAFLRISQKWALVARAVERACIGIIQGPARNLANVKCTFQRLGTSNRVWKSPGSQDLKIRSLSSLFSKFSLSHRQSRSHVRVPCAAFSQRHWLRLVPTTEAVFCGPYSSTLYNSTSTHVCTRTRTHASTQTHTPNISFSSNPRKVPRILEPWKSLNPCRSSLWHPHLPLGISMDSIKLWLPYASIAISVSGSTDFSYIYF